MTSKKQVNQLRETQAELLDSDNSIKKLYAKDAMTKPILLYQDDSVKLILKKLRKEHINACIVVTKEKKFLGEISDNDIIKLFLKQVKCEPLVQILNHGYRREFLFKTAKEMVNSHKSIVNPETPINKVIELCFQEGFEYIPVVDKSSKVIGVITPSSIINILRDY